MLVRSFFTFSAAAGLSFFLRQIEVMGLRRSSLKVKTLKDVSLRKVTNGVWMICETDCC